MEDKTLAQLIVDKKQEHQLNYIQEIQAVQRRAAVGACGCVCGEIRWK